MKLFEIRMLLEWFGNRFVQKINLENSQIRDSILHGSEVKFADRDTESLVEWLEIKVWEKNYNASLTPNFGTWTHETKI